eukprot:c28870_g1_i3 orf=314-799(+)
MNSAFNGQILAEKLSKLNSSQQSIETLSHWCIFHRKKARQVVETWDKQFRELPKERVPFLYLVNDILQNSRRRGGEYVTEFWRILPGALKDAMEKCDENGRNVVLRLVLRAGGACQQAGSILAQLVLTRGEGRPADDRLGMACRTNTLCHLLLYNGEALIL